jgi:hypothetical protein
LELIANKKGVSKSFLVRKKNWKASLNGIAKHYEGKLDVDVFTPTALLKRFQSEVSS